MAVEENRLKKSQITGIFNLNTLLVVLIIGMISFGALVLYSIGLGSFTPWASKHLITMLVFIPVCLIVMNINYRFIFDHSYHCYIFCVCVLILVLALGHTAMGAQRWLNLGVFNLQPSEFMKLGVILALSRYYKTIKNTEIAKIKHLSIPLLIIIIPAVLILKQPNLGTTIVVLLTSATIMFMAGVRMWKFNVVIIGVILAAPLIWMNMHDYQKQRVMTFMDPESDRLGAGYNIIQSKIAIGSGGVVGKGFLQGTQSQLRFLPERQTDFILSVVAEEFGFVGVACVFGVTFVIILLCIIRAFKSYNQFYRLIAIGMASCFFFHAIINAGMISGLLPVVGMPYPLLSFGRSSMVFFMIGFALVLNRKLKDHPG